MGAKLELYARLEIGHCLHDILKILFPRAFHCLCKTFVISVEIDSMMIIKNKTNNEMLQML